jgi:hypothetical protein
VDIDPKFIENQSSSSEFAHLNLSSSRSGASNQQSRDRSGKKLSIEPSSFDTGNGDGVIKSGSKNRRN